MCVSGRASHGTRGQEVMGQSRGLRRDNSRFDFLLLEVGDHLTGCDPLLLDRRQLLARLLQHSVASARCARGPRPHASTETSLSDTEASHRTRTDGRHLLGLCLVRRSFPPRLKRFCASSWLVSFSFSFLWSRETKATSPIEKFDVRTKFPSFRPVPPSPEG